MVAPNKGRPRRRKWRFHCATCGEPLADAPQLWAYCSKECEIGRSGSPEPPSMREDAVDRYLELAVRLESTFVREDRERLQSEMRQLQLDREPESVKRENFSSERMDPATAEFWVNPIRREADRFELAMRRSLSAATKLGVMLIEAKEHLSHGEFGRLFRDHRNAVPGAMPFGATWARRLMAMASHPLIAKQEHAAALPADLESVYLLTKLDEQELAAAIESGAVTPKMRREDVRALVSHDAADDAPPSDDELLVRLIDPFRMRLVAFAADRPQMLSDLRTRLKAMLRAVEQAANGPKESA